MQEIYGGALWIFCSNNRKLDKYKSKQNTGGYAFFSSRPVQSFLIFSWTVREMKMTCNILCLHFMFIFDFLKWEIIAPKTILHNFQTGLLPKYKIKISGEN